LTSSRRLKASRRAVEELSANALAAMLWVFECWAHEHQVAPAGDWKTWVILGGRGAGKTRAGSEWVRAQVEGAGPYDPGQARRVALVAETLDQARDVMVMGDSGIIACSPEDRRPVWQATQRRLLWPNGAQAQIFSAYDPDRLRGPQFDAAWVDELAKWKNGKAAWNMLQFGLRLGRAPRQVVTTTPRSTALLRDVLAQADTVLTKAPSQANRAYLADGFLEHVEGLYGGTRMAPLWTLERFDAARLHQVPPLDRVVVAVDPPVTSGAGADACGMGHPDGMGAGGD